VDRGQSAVNDYPHLYIGELSYLHDCG
jgi:hypothetical protein